MNAVSHRDYQMGGSIFIRQYHDRLTIESPGGFPVGISLDNILDRQLPRNRRIAEILALCGLVERSGQGMNLIYELSIKEAKQLPDFSGTDDYFVQITLNGMILDKRMLSVIHQIGEERWETLTTMDFLVINALYKELLLQHIIRNGTSGTPFRELQQVLPSNNRGQIQVLLRELRSEGQIHCIGRTNGAKWFAKGELL